MVVTHVDTQQPICLIQLTLSRQLRSSNNLTIDVDGVEVLLWIQARLANGGGTIQCLLERLPAGTNTASPAWFR